MDGRACLEEGLASLKTAFWPVCPVVVCTLGRPFPAGLRAMFRSYSTCGVRVGRPRPLVNLCPRSCSSVSPAKNPSPLLSRLLCAWIFFAPRLHSCVLELIDSKDRKRFRSTPGAVGSGVSPSNRMGGFHISVGCFDVISRDLGPTLVCSILDCTSGVAPPIQGSDKQPVAEGRSIGFSSSMRFSKANTGSLP